MASTLGIVPDDSAIDPRAEPLPGARSALVLLLAINMFNYVDRQVLAAVESKIAPELHATKAMMGWTATAFLVSYMLLSPLFGWLGDRTSRWLWIAVGVLVWSLASGATGLATGFAMFILTRCFVGVGEAAYGPVAPTLLSDLYPVRERGRILSWFNLAIPVGSALGYVLGGAIATHWSWRWAFYLVVPPGILLGILALFMREPPRGLNDTGANLDKAKVRLQPRDYLLLLRTPSFVLDTLGMAAMTFAIGGIGFWMPRYLEQLGTAGNLARVNLAFGAIMVVAGLSATLIGGWAGDRLRSRYSGAYFLVSAAGLIGGFAMFLVMLYTPFPTAWIFLFAACFCLFFNTGPSNAILANVTHPSMRATAFAVNILVIHTMGDAVSPPIIGWIADRSSLRAGFLVVSGMMLVGGLFWAWGARYLERDTRMAPMLLDRA